MASIDTRLIRLEAVHAPRGPIRLKAYTTSSSPDDWPGEQWGSGYIVLTPEQMAEHRGEGVR